MNMLFSSKIKSLMGICFNILLMLKHIPKNSKADKWLLHEFKSISYKNVIC